MSVTMDKVRIKQVIESLKGLSPEQIYEALTQIDVPREEKSIIFTLGSFQPYILLDGDLQRFIMDHREKAYGHLRGSLNEDPDEVSLILKAYLSPQYRRYIKHLMISFTDDSNEIFPVKGFEVEECGLCHKKIYQYSHWESICQANPSFGEQDRKEYLSIGSHQSNNSICTNCLVQLRAAKDLLEYLMPGFLYEF